MLKRDDKYENDIYRWSILRIIGIKTTNIKKMCEFSASMLSKEVLNEAIKEFNKYGVKEDFFEMISQELFQRFINEFQKDTSFDLSLLLEVRREVKKFYIDKIRNLINEEISYLIKDRDYFIK